MSANFQCLFTSTSPAPTHSWKVSKQGFNLSLLVIGCYFSPCFIPSMRFQFERGRCKSLVKWWPVMATLSLTMPPWKLGLLLFYAIIHINNTQTGKNSLLFNVFLYFTSCSTVRKSRDWKARKIGSNAYSRQADISLWNMSPTVRIIFLVWWGYHLTSYFTLWTGLLRIKLVFLTFRLWYPTWQSPIPHHKTPQRSPFLSVLWRTFPMPLNTLYRSVHLSGSQYMLLVLVLYCSIVVSLVHMGACTNSKIYLTERNQQDIS